MTDTGFTALLQALRLGPVMTDISPLEMLCLPPEVEIVTDVEELVEQLDALERHAERLALIPHVYGRYKHRFKVVSSLTSYTPSDVDQMLPLRLADARRLLLTHRGVADRIVSDASQHRYRVVALLLVDGLSYEDVKSWSEVPEACFVDGPSITYSLVDDRIVPDVGFPGIIGVPPLARRLVDVGIPHSTGFSYWRRERNDVSALLFAGAPLTRVGGIDTALKLLAQQPLQGTYVQLMREGLDGLAHSRREVTRREIEATVSAIYDDYRQLIQIIASTGLPGAAYLTSDHGILWKAQHPGLQRVKELSSVHPRYNREGETAQEYGTEFPMCGQTYTLYRYPYLGAAVRANDSGIHGGLSYWESLVPFVRVEVNT